MLTKTKYQEDDYFKWINKSIKFSKLSIEKLDEIRNADTDKAGYRNRKFFYTVNLYLFTLIQTATENEFNTIETAHIFELLRNSEFTPEYWQPRFHDTIARYYMRKAVLANTLESFTQFLLLASEQNRKCEASSKKKEIFNPILREKIIELEAEGFENIKKRIESV